jgi:hypothetical protein
LSPEESGTFRCYVPKRFSEDALKTIARANQIIDQYHKQGYALTLRQLYYQFVARALIPNEQRAYDRLGALISDGRLAGLISWDAIEDRTRNLMGQTYWESPAQILKSAASGYKMDKWADQDWHPEVWVEKEALVGVISGVCGQLGVDYFACRGYNSQSEQWRAGQRFRGYMLKGQRPIVFHLGDHDPSGLDMTRDNRDRLTLFAGTPVTVVRLALNRPQIDQYHCPPNPAKVTDARFRDYEREHGAESWELDALPPDAIATLIKTAVLQIRDAQRWDEALRREAQDRLAIEEIAQEMGDLNPEES